MKRRLFLASSSPRRAEILKHHHIPFTVIENKLSSEILPETPHQIRYHLRKLAYEKAASSQADHRGLIVGVDTTVWIDNRILGKPKDREEAREFLTYLSGKIHFVTTGVCIIDTILNKTYKFTDTTEVRFLPLSKIDIQSYCTHYPVLDKAGGYAIQDHAQTFVKTIKGSYFNIVGLPIEKLLKFIRNYAIV